MMNGLMEDLFRYPVEEKVGMMITFLRVKNVKVGEKACCIR